MTRYTKPGLRDRLKEEIKASDKGGRPGQWSARKAQLLAHEYKRHGGAYVGGKDRRGKHLEQWTRQEWQTRQGSGRADTGKRMKRYLPRRAWELLSEEERKSTDRRKRAGKEQYVANTPAARAARAYVDHGDATRLEEEQLQRLSKEELARLARDYDIHGRSHRSKGELARSLHRAFEQANTGMSKHELQEKADTYGVRSSRRKEELVHDIVRASELRH